MCMLGVWELNCGLPSIIWLLSPFASNWGSHWSGSKLWAELRPTTCVCIQGPKVKVSQLSGEGQDRSLESKRTSPTSQANFKPLFSSHALTKWHWPKLTTWPRSRQGDGKWFLPTRMLKQAWEFLAYIKRVRNHNKPINHRYGYSIYLFHHVVAVYTPENRECIALCFSEQQGIHFHSLAELKCTLPEEVWNLSSVSAACYRASTEGFHYWNGQKCLYFEAIYIVKINGNNLFPCFSSVSVILTYIQILLFCSQCMMLFFSLTFLILKCFL